MLRRILSVTMLICSLAGLAAGDPAASAAPLSAAPPLIPLAAPQAPASLLVTYETEPNNVYTAATPLFGASNAVQGDILPGGDVDFYSFTAAAGQRVFAAVMTNFGPDGDSVMDLIGSDGSTIVETDDDDGSIDDYSSSIAGALIPSTGVYYLKVRNFGAEVLQQYVLHVFLTVGSASSEVEPNNSTGQAETLANNAWIAGTRASGTDADVYAVPLAAGDTIFASLDLSPTTPGPEWNGRLSLGYFGGDALIVDSSGTTDHRDSEALMVTVKSAGTYYLIVDAATTDTGSYQLILHVSGDDSAGLGCATFESDNVPQVIPSGPGVITSTLTIPESFPSVFPISDLNVSIVLTHTYMRDLDAVLVSPAGNTNALFTDVGNAAAGVVKTMDVRLDDEAASPIDAFLSVDDLVVQPEGEYRLNLFDGEPATGTWSLVLYDDVAADGGNLLSWSITACFTLPLADCPNGTSMVDVFAADFESGTAGFTHSGTQDEWELGLPTAAPVTGCASGSSCWATDLDSTYNANSSQDLYSPLIDLTGYVSDALVVWQQKYQLQTAAADHAYVEVLADVAPPQLRVWEWRDPTMTVSVGNPVTVLQESGGWGMHIADIQSLLGQEIQLRFHLDSNGSNQYAGLAIDDVSVFACHATPIYIPVVTR